MDKIAFIIGETFLYWNSIFLVLGILTACLLFLAFYLGRSGNAIGAFLAVPLSIGLSMVLARLVHWYCQTDSYSSLFAALTDYFSGGYALCGAFFGCILAGCILRICQAIRNLPQYLDCMALAGAAGIGVGRLGSFFTNADRGQILEGSWGLPFAWPIVHPVTGASENRIAIFLIQAMICGAIFLILTVFWLSTRKKNRSGDTFLLFLLLYGAAQIILDSMRYDSLFLRSNGFVSLVQILAALAVVFPIILFSVRSVRARGFGIGHCFAWLLIAACLGYAGYMEYYVQRHGNLAQYSYTVMTVCMAVVVLLTVTLYLLKGKKPQ